MAYHDDLLAHALALVHAQPQSELSLRRAVSAAYYAVFHLLIFEATEHWDNKGLRTILGRAYDHGLMKTTSNRILDSREFPFTNENPQVVSALKDIAQGFSQLQEDRQSELWTQKADGVIQTGVLVAPDGTVYYGDYGRDSGVTHLHAIDARGNALWTVDLQRVSMSQVALGARGRLFVGGSALDARILCLAD